MYFLINKTFFSWTTGEKATFFKMAKIFFSRNKMRPIMYACISLFLVGIKIRTFQSNRFFGVALFC
jgi:hypothetical protein